MPRIVVVSVPATGPAEGPIEKPGRSKMRQLRTHLQTVLASLGIGGGLVLIPLLPRAAVVGMARVLGDAAFLLLGGLRRVALANLDVAFGETTSQDRKRAIVRQSFRNAALLGLDAFWFAVFCRRRLRRYVHFDSTLDPLFREHPLIVITGHFGNWEAAGLALAAAGAPLVSVAAPLKIAPADAFVNWTRRRTGQAIVFRRGALRALIRTLRSGGRVALLLDQNTSPRKGGIFVPFFGLPAPVSAAPALLAARTGAPVMLAYTLPTGRGHYRVYGSPPVWFDATASSEVEITADIMARLERIIRQRPEHWMWMYKRWKYVVAEHGREGYPYYARHRAAASRRG